MKAEPIVKRGLEILGLLMIGEGVVGLLFPTRYSRFWNVGPAWMRKTATASPLIQRQRDWRVPPRLRSGFG